MTVVSGIRSTSKGDIELRAHPIYSRKNFRFCVCPYFENLNLRQLQLTFAKDLQHSTSCTVHTKQQIQSRFELHIIYGLDDQNKTGLWFSWLERCVYEANFCRFDKVRSFLIITSFYVTFFAFAKSRDEKRLIPACCKAFFFFFHFLRKI